MSTTEHHVELSDGAKVQVWLLGGEDQTKPLLIGLHGAPGLSSHTEPKEGFSFLADKFRVLVYDARGSGVSDLKGPLTDQRWITDVDEIRYMLFFHFSVTSLIVYRAWAGAETFVLAGGSYGGFLALTYALAYPERLSALILRDTWAWGLRGTFRALASILTSGVVKPDVARQVRLWSGSLHDNDDFEKSFTEILPIYSPPDKITSAPLAFEGRSESTSGLHYESQNAAFSVSVPRFDVRSRLGEISVPTLILVGRHDVICPVEDSEELHRGIANSEMVVFENSGHNPAQDEPDAFRGRLSEFLDKLRL